MPNQYYVAIKTFKTPADLKRVNYNQFDASIS